MKEDQSEIIKNRLFWNRLKSNKLALFGGSIIIIFVIIAILGYIITPDSTPMANRQIIEIATIKPGSKIRFIKLNKNQKIPSSSFFKKLFSGERKGYRLIPIENFSFDQDKILVKEYTGIADEEFISSYNLVHVVEKVKLVLDYNKMNNSVRYLNLEGEEEIRMIDDLKKKFINNHIISKRFILGTDRFGRDLLSRMIIGTRISLSVGFMSVIVSLIIGVSMGALGGYFGGRVDSFVMYIINVVWSIPTLLMAIALTLVFGKGFWQLFLAIGFTMWVEVARVIRGQIMSLREKEFVLAGKVLGLSPARILFIHILPNTMNPVIIISAANFASAILLEAGLSFLGIGVQPPVPSWGAMIKNHYGYIIVDMPYLALIPGIAIMLMVLSFTFVGNGLRDAFDNK